MKTLPPIRQSGSCDHPTCKFKARWKVEIAEREGGSLTRKRFCELHKKVQENSIQAEIGRGRSIFVKRMH